MRDTTPYQPPPTTQTTPSGSADQPTGTLIALPHSGLRVPHTRLTVTGYRELVSVCGIAFTATLRLDTVPAGVVFNEGVGGATTYRPHTATVFTGRQLADFTAACRTAGGHQPDVETVLDDLVTEATTARRVARAIRRRQTPLRLVTRLWDDEPDIVPIDHAAAPDVRTDADLRRLAARLAADDPPEPGEWWQRWDGHTWIDLTPPGGTS